MASTRTVLGDDSPLRPLWPAPARVRSTWLPGRGTNDYLALPTGAAPRMLVPIGTPGADRLLVRFGGSRRRRAARSFLGLATRSGALRWLPGPRLRVKADPAGIEAHLAGVLGRAVTIGVMLGPPRANLKPVLQIFGARGEILGFAKVGTSSTTAPLLHTEAEALQWLAKHPVDDLVVPELLDFSMWREIPVLVQAPLPLAQSGRQPTALPSAQLASLAVSGGVTWGALGSSPFWIRVSEVGEEHWHGLDVAAFRRLRDAIDVQTVIGLGAWHGDFGPWNAAAGLEHLEVWDWERFEGDVPVGLDAAHWRTQVALVGGAEPHQSWTSMVADVEQLASDAGVGNDGGVTAACYILAIWSRYRHVDIESDTPRLRRRVRWLCALADVARKSLEEERS